MDFDSQMSIFSIGHKLEKYLFRLKFKYFIKKYADKILEWNMKMEYKWADTCKITWVTQVLGERQP